MVMSRLFPRLKTNLQICLKPLEPGSILSCKCIDLGAKSLISFQNPVVGSMVWIHKPDFL